MKSFIESPKNDHALTRVDARIKLIISASILIMVLSCRGFLFPLFITALCFSICMKMRTPLKVFALRFSEPMFIASVLVVLKLFFSGKEPLFSFDLFSLTLTGHRDGLLEGLMIAVRIAGAVSIMTVLGFSTPFTEFMAGVSWLRIPRTFVDVLMFAYRYIFVLFDDAMVIYSAQKNRLGYSNIRRGLSSFGTLTGSLILKAFENSQNTTVAMVQRGYDGNMPMLKHKPFNSSELIGSALLIVIMAAVWKI